MTLPVDPARWLPDSTPPLERAIVLRALSDIGICENPPGSNRSGVIDEYNRRAGAPLGSYWCASAMGVWIEDAGGQTPAGRASCDNWYAWAKTNGLWTLTPRPGYGVLYGVGDDAQHCGVVVRITPLLLSVEGNTSLGGQFSRNGVAVDLKEVNQPRRLGYIIPSAA